MSELGLRWLSWKQLYENTVGSNPTQFYWWNSLAGKTLDSYFKNKGSTPFFISKKTSNLIG